MQFLVQQKISEEWRVKGAIVIPYIGFIVFVIMVIINVSMGIHRLIPLVGLCVAVLIGYAISYDRAGIRSVSSYGRVSGDCQTDTAVWILCGCSVGYAI